ncbi:MAG: hypothetical protein HOH33_04315, partial [Verrucomicrobia bacterium]|nr:hypothetical protein [Verrucomicrobiota bacterium]
NTIDDPAFRQSLYAVTSEIAALTPYLNNTASSSVTATIIPDLFEPKSLGVKTLVVHHGSNSIIILVNKDAHRHLGVEIHGLDKLNGKRLHLLYGQEMQTPNQGSFITRMQANEIKVFATDPGLAKGIPKGRDYVDKQ